MPFTDVKGVRTFYEEYGDPTNNKHVLFIHGLGEGPGIYHKDGIANDYLKKIL